MRGGKQRKMEVSLHRKLQYILPFCGKRGCQFFSWKVLAGCLLRHLANVVVRSYLLASHFTHDLRSGSELKALWWNKQWHWGKGFGLFTRIINDDLLPPDKYWYILNRAFAEEAPDNITKSSVVLTFSLEISASWKEFTLSEQWWKLQ